MENIVCPFCGFPSNSPYTIQLHVEEQHTDDSPFVARQDVSSPSTTSTAASSSSPATRSSRSSIPADEWLRCTRPNCGKYLLLSDASEHQDLHMAQELSLRENAEQPRIELRQPRYVHEERERPSPSTQSARPPRSPRRLEKRPPSSSTSSSLRSWFSGSSSRNGRPPPRRLPPPRAPGRLGRRELGPHAFEERMPDEVLRRLEYYSRRREVQRIGRDGRLYHHEFNENETRGLVPALTNIFSLDDETKATYFCHPSVRHVHKLPVEGNYCGYWSIQTVLTYFQHMQPSRHSATPGVLEIQDLIEAAWNQGICSYGRIETGGVRGTRKWIGTHEALAFFTQIRIEVEALTFSDSEQYGSAAEQLLDYVEAYFMSGLDAADHFENSHVTQLPPMYFQRLGHSMAIVGLERMEDGSRNLVVFDSGFATPPPMERLARREPARCRVEDVLRVYRRSDTSLSRWKDFEILVPKVPAREVARVS